MILPVGASSYEEAMNMGTEVHQQLMAVIKNKYVQDPTNVGDEGVSAPNIQEKKEGLELLKIAIDKAGYTNQVVIASDFAASEFSGSDKTYDLNLKEENTDASQQISGDALNVVYKSFVFEHPNVSIEDAFDQDNWKQTYNTLPLKNLNHGGIGRMSVLNCIGQSSESMEVDPYNAQVSKLQHNEGVNWKHVNWVNESLERFFDEVRFPIRGRFKAVREMARIGAEDNDDALMKRSSVTFTDKDMVVAGEHNQPLCIDAKINSVACPLTIIDNGSSENLISYIMFKASCNPNSLVPEPLCITGVMGSGNTLGHVTAVLEVGLISSATRFHVIDANSDFHILLGRPWIHEFKGVPSTYHQCFKGIFQGKEVVIKAS